MSPSPKVRASVRKKVDILTTVISTMLEIAEDGFDLMMKMKIQRPFRRSKLTRLRREFLILQQSVLAADNPNPDIGAGKEMAGAINQLYTQLMDGLEVHFQRYTSKTGKDLLKTLNSMRRCFASVAREALP
ncbi:hypothetical protein [Microvirga sp. VF16]|uniref:hypothetical protein n=1 Tax=Microvirga sp. VF16 TaxID=2807101 RepID=UPI00193E6333|nr:hypothetical protein [Microvirga sp. VF16]QRM34827.1 hypothetical protein JO965_41950 [Microvirga sp. VF16]